MVLHGVVLHGVVLYGVVLYGVVLQGVVWCSVVWWGAVWCYVVRCPEWMLFIKGSVVGRWCLHMTRPLSSRCLHMTRPLSSRCLHMTRPFSLRCLHMTRPPSGPLRKPGPGTAICCAPSVHGCAAPAPTATPACSACSGASHPHAYRLCPLPPSLPSAHTHVSWAVSPVLMRPCLSWRSRKGTIVALHTCDGNSRYMGVDWLGLCMCVYEHICVRVECECVRVFMCLCLCVRL